MAFSATGEALFAIWSGGETPQTDTPRYSEIGIMVSGSDEVQRVFSEWKKNPAIEIVKEPYTEVFGLTFLVKDPDGHIIRVCPVD